MTYARIGDVVRIVSDNPGYVGRIGHVVDVFCDNVRSRYQEGVILQRDKYVVELIPLDKEPIVELIVRPLSVKTLEMHPLKKVGER